MSLVTQAPESDSESKEDIIHERKVDYDPQHLSPKVPFPSSRESSPSTPPPVSSLIRRTTPFHQPKTLVLDLDETLIHSTIRPMRGSSGLFGFEFGGKRLGKGHVVEVLLNGRRTKYHVYKRPFVDYFLRKVI
jgi:CTD nuclear envelope phosphatase 1